MTQQHCIRECKSFRRHVTPCQAAAGADGYWGPLTIPGYTPEEVRELAFDADFHITEPPWREGVYVGRYGGIDTWHHCPGCKPRRATHGLLCASCHGRLHDRLTGQHGIRWAYDELDDDLIPSQGSGQKVSGSSTPTPPVNLNVMDLQREILTAAGDWLWALADRFNLHGPDWWRIRIEQTSRRAWAPQTSDELGETLTYINAWLDRLEQEPDLIVTLYDQADQILRKTSHVAPWKAKPRRIPGAVCPNCDRTAITVLAGSDRASCQRCDANYDRRRFESSEEILAEHNREKETSTR